MGRVREPPKELIVTSDKELHEYSDAAGIPIQKGGYNRPWVWTDKKRQAVELVAKGWTDTRIAKELQVHRHSIRTWRHHAAFYAAVVTEARDYVNRVRMKRVLETGLILDQLAGQVAKRLVKAQEGDSAYTKADLETMQLFLREYREYREQERQDFGDKVTKIEGSLAVQQSIEPSTQQSFQAFLERHMSEQSGRKIIRPIAAHSAQDALVQMTRDILMDADVAEQTCQPNQKSSA